MDLTDNTAHILIVDDDQPIRNLLAHYLFKNGFRVTTANDAASARASMRGLAFDVVILDVMMPGENGLDLARDDSTGSERAIDVQINRLRRKIESDPANPLYLQTVRGKGYILHAD